MAMFLVFLRRSGPEYVASRPAEEQTGWDDHAAYMDGLVEDCVVVLGGPLADEHRAVLVFEAASTEAVRETLARDPWAETHLRLDAIEPWTVRLDGRRR